MQGTRLLAAGGLAVLVACAVVAGAHRLMAAESQVVAERRQAVIYLNGQQSLQMQGDSIPGYSGGTTALPFLLQNGWRLVSLHIADNAQLTGYAVLEKN